MYVTVVTPSHSPDISKNTMFTHKTGNRPNAKIHVVGPGQEGIKIPSMQIVPTIWHNNKCITYLEL